MNSKKVLDVILIIVFILTSAIGGYLWYDYKLVDVEYEESVKVGEEISVKKYLLPDEKTNLKVDAYRMFVNHYNSHRMTFSEFLISINRKDSKTLKTLFGLFHTVYDDYEGGLLELKYLLNEPDKELMVNSESRSVNNGDAKVEAYILYLPISSQRDLTFTDFIKLINDNPDELNRCYKRFIGKGYEKSKKDFKILLGLSN